MNWIFADIQRIYSKHGYTSNTSSKSANTIIVQLIKYNQIYNYTDKSHTIINIVQCHLHECEVYFNLKGYLFETSVYYVIRIRPNAKTEPRMQNYVKQSIDEKYKLN